MSCRQVQERFVDFLDGEVRPTERVMVTAHVNLCGVCRGVLHELEETLEMARDSLAHPDPRDRFPQLMERIATEEAQHRVQWPRVWRLIDHRRTIVAAAAGLALMVGIAGPVASRLTQRPESRAAQVETATQQVEAVSVVSAPFVAYKRALDEGLAAEHLQEAEDSESVADGS